MLSIRRGTAILNKVCAFHSASLLSAATATPSSGKRTHECLKLLGGKVNTKSTQEQLKLAYFEQSKTCHPDLHGETKLGEFNRLKEAFEELSQRRARKEEGFKVFQDHYRRNVKQRVREGRGGDMFWGQYLKVVRTREPKEVSQ